MRLLANRILTDNGKGIDYYILYEQGKFNTPLAILTLEDILKLLDSLEEQNPKAV
jgi:hypothetical protein